MENIQRKLFLNYFLYFFTFILLCFYGISHASAVTWVNIGDQSNVTVVLVSTDYGDSPYTVPKGSQYNFYQVTAIDIIVDNYNFTANTTYQLEMDFTNQKLINANKYVVYGLNGEFCSITYNTEYTHFDGQYPRWSFSCPHSTSTITIEISNSSGGYLWPQQQQNIFTWVYSYLKYTNVSVGGGDNSDIINNQNQNFNDCHVSVNLFNSSFRQGNVNGNTSVLTQIFDDINYQIISGQDYTFSTNLDTSIYKYQLFLNDNTFPKSASDYEEYTSGWKTSSTFTFNLNSTGYLGLAISRIDGNNISPSNISNFYFQLQLGTKATSYEQYGVDICINRLDATKDAINGLNDSLNDDDTDGATSEATDFFESFTTDTFGLTSIITAPLNLIRSVIGDGSICTTLHLPLPYLDNKYLDLPCMYGIYSQYFGSFFTIYQTITYGIVAYWVIVRIFNQVKDFKNPEHDEIEVMDL